MYKKAKSLPLPVKKNEPKEEEKPLEAVELAILQITQFLKKK